MSGVAELAGLLRTGESLPSLAAPEIEGALSSAEKGIVLGADEVGRLTEASDNFHPVQGAAALPKLLRNRLPF